MVLVVDGGATLKAWRGRQGKMSQMQLAVALGVSMPAVSQWERNINTPRREMAERIDEHLGAGGAVLAAFGYLNPPDDDDQQERLRSQVAELSEAVEALAAQVKAQGAELRRLVRLSRQSSAEA